MLLDSLYEIFLIFASVRSTIKPEPQSPVRPNAETRLYTGQMFDSRDDFVDAVHSHTEERNPGCRLAVAHTDPARVRVYCMRPDCEYSFNSVYEHGARGVPGIKVTAVSPLPFFANATEFFGLAEQSKPQHNMPGLLSRRPL